MNPYLVAPNYFSSLLAKRDKNVPLAPVGTTSIYFSRLCHVLKIINAK